MKGIPRERQQSYSLYAKFKTWGIDWKAAEDQNWDLLVSLEVEATQSPVQIPLSSPSPSFSIALLLSFFTFVSASLCHPSTTISSFSNHSLSISLSCPGSTLGQSSFTCCWLENRDEHPAPLTCIAEVSSHQHCLLELRFYLEMSFGMHEIL